MKNSFLDNYFSERLNFHDDPHRYSCLMLALRDARLIANRNVDTGIVTLEYGVLLLPNKWPAALVYLIILDQIGTCFRNKNKKIFSGNCIFKAIKYFSNVQDSEAKAIEALRHSFAHNFGLCNVSRNNKEEIIKDKTHLFTVIANKENPLVTLPLDSWDGIVNDKKENKFTTINLWKLGDFVEDIVSTLKKEYQDNNVELILPGGIDELKTRFTILI